VTDDDATETIGTRAQIEITLAIEFDEPWVMLESVS
jgi:hypothetical protein